MNNDCCICGTKGAKQPTNSVPYEPRFACDICGRFRLSEHAAQRLFEVSQGYPLSDHHLVSAVIRDRYESRQRAEVFITDFQELRAAAVPLHDIFHSVDRILLYVARRADRMGDQVDLNACIDYPVALARDADEFAYFVELAEKIGFIETEEQFRARPTLDGWRRLQQLRVQDVEPNTAFVAMQFAEDLRTVYEVAIEPALRTCGFNAIRVDLVEHNGKIDDRIVADIRKSYLLVADFSGHRQNVYFEAGFALGLGRHVIWTCRESDVANAHFDTRQYNHVVWEDAADLKNRLVNRIRATIPGHATTNEPGTA